MAGKPKMLRDLEGLPDEALKEVEQFIAELKKCRGAKQIAGRNGKALAHKQLSAIKRWAGKNLGTGFAGREHDAVLYEGKR
ncbi:MAG: hypothetical protein ACE5HC_11430 [Candidatus Binatia bacterium]